MLISLNKNNNNLLLLSPTHSSAVIRGKKQFGNAVELLSEHSLEVWDQIDMTNTIFALVTFSHVLHDFYPIISF